MVNAFIFIVAAAGTKYTSNDFSMSATMNGVRKGSFVGCAKYGSDGTFKDWCCETYSHHAVTQWVWRSFDKNGRPIRVKYLKTGFQYKNAVTLDYQKDVVVITTVDNYKSSTTTKQIPTGLPLENKAIYWFFSKTPKIGDSWICRELDFRTLRWVTKTTRYVRSEELDCAGKKVKAHVVVEENPEIDFTYTSWFGPRGVTYKSKVLAYGQETQYANTTR